MRLGFLVLIAVCLAPLPATALLPLKPAELWRQGQLAQSSGHWDEAIAIFSALLKLEPRHVNSHVALGYSHYKKGELDVAAKLYRQALVLAPHHVGAGYGLGQLAMARKNWSEASGLFRNVLRAAPAYEPVRTRHNLALSLVAQEHRAEAAQVFEEALTRPTAGHYAQLYLDAMSNALAREEYSVAAKWGESGTQRYPQDPWLWDKLAWALKKCRERERAAAAYERAESLVYQDIPPQSQTVLSLPFHGVWRVTQGNGGDVSHRGLGARFAWDFEATTESGRTRIGPGRDNEDYYSFGQDVLAPADGRVVAVEDNVADNEPHHRDASLSSGNYVLIEHAPGEFSSLGHLQNGSVEVEVGQQVRRGQRLARCGNSGHAALPHLHYSFIRLYNGKKVSWPAQFFDYVTMQDGERKSVERGVPQQGTLIENVVKTP